MNPIFNKFTFAVIMTAVAISTSVVHAGTNSYKFTNVEYVASGECGQYKVSGAPSGVTITYKDFFKRTKQAFYFVGQGPTDDGAGGCSKFKAIIECASSKGNFVVGEDDGWGPFHVPPYVSEFTCVQ